jgi:hypothetical protein
MKAWLAGAAAAAAVGLGSTACAAIETFDITWSGASFSDPATATGFIIVDTASLPTTGSVVPVFLPSVAVLGLGITVNDPDGGSGTFGMADFDGLYFWAPTSLNLGTQLIGQNVGGGDVYGDPDGNGGDFNLFSLIPGVPDGYIYFTLADGAGNLLQVTSIAPAPEPSSWALMIGGVFGVGALLRRRRAGNPVAA